MARSSSPVFNEAPSVPADASEPVMVTKTSTSSGAAPAADASVSSASATPTATASSSVVATTPAPAASDCLKAASGAASPSGVDATADAASPAPSQRFARVPPAVLQSVKASLTFRKSCLKRSKSSALPPAAFEAHPAASALKAEAPAEKKEDTKPVQKNRRRCWQCKVKVGLTAVKCRCDYTFCGKHRYAEEHNCAFNFKTAGKRKLEEENPIVVPSKVARIN
ncbi:zinc finger protein a20 domain-containing [Phytophthora cinnamomi]|uniref:zinc finger protein a20 domain-containing n=1 Tax=Phytophthora cinnamomi TaxID=4785 RepID=UPI00355A4017|nr:zinc finger protein a20 domain-containing [Phytophthora cinnamomi]